MARDLMSDEEWALFERFVLTVRAPNGRKPTNHCLALDGVFWIARTGALWRDVPAELGRWSSVDRQFRRWTLTGLWEQIMDALNESGAVQHTLQMIDSVVVRGDHQAAGAKGGHRDVLPVIPMRKSRKKRAGVDRASYRLRKLVERCFNELKNARRVATRHDKTAEGFIDITLIRLWLRHLST